MKMDLDATLKARGQKINGYLPVAQRYDGSDIALPVMVAVGLEEGPVLVLDGCHHGDEHEGSEGIIKLIQSLDTAKLKGTVIGVPVVNVLAFEQGDRFAPQYYYGSDLNRAYPGSPTGRVTQRIAYAYAQNIVARADYVVTMHGGGNKWTLVPTVICEAIGNKEVDEKSKRLAKAFGANFIWKGTDFPGTLRSVTQKLGIPIVCAELGGQATRDNLREEYTEMVCNGLKNIMAEIGMLDEKPRKMPDPIWVEPPVYITNTKGGFFEALKKAGELAKEDELLAVVKNMFGEVVEELRAPYCGVVCSHWSYPMAVAGNWVVIYGKTV